MGTHEPIKLGFEPQGTTHIFTSSDGSEYGIPNPVPATLTLTAMEKAASIGEAAAVVWVMREVFTAEGYGKLKAEASGKQLAQVMEVVSDLVLGELEGKG